MELLEIPTPDRSMSLAMKLELLLNLSLVADVWLSIWIAIRDDVSEMRAEMGMSIFFIMRCERYG